MAKLHDMTPQEIETVLEAAFARCDRDNCPLDAAQKQILRQIIIEELVARAELTNADSPTEANPLDELGERQRQALLNYVRAREQQERSWKAELLNDWLLERDSGSVQFIRDEYGPTWLERVKPVHLSAYFELQEDEDGLRLKVGDRIEVCNRLWEWVQMDEPGYEEWFPCTVVGISQESDPQCSYTCCIIRFDNGAEFEIPGIDQWNRYNWRWSNQD